VTQGGSKPGLSRVVATLPTRKKLIKLQNSTSELRGRAGTSDTGNRSMDSIRPMEHGIVEEDFAAAFH
jgi:hypothetical protein